ncbi:MAG: tRNA (adenosine(37)-N6)-dimethylallyltransferase MiaA [Parcubacteria group bacterium CG1_02_37_51]|uniref:tRNA dimethylallyltransferase n=2 Tax=Candidatus Komeiliibacteriota TaxID=1817908 RepID=A0A2M8DS79_9BACT|nr:MAG: tRNA (adenosine(37)-N6)-dimethylallyltransferase MiaA [Parcubacteria group bacterium CG1_02_37_51]PIY94875.1 MAG: tRNA (adenosine(37)-N6)-dimethylallyltransferase MiaA [Candidatus Komeilibacteria bacterium CG_4_10_14_0_8_um_filter_37_78]PJC02245.1 MAG: tRNA (adenosine(37)-N6)-dimethylallyltransferase MiaA [Candidatus Komeilibacteria bacterium CG_4_9_14_0_8_um_filter_36_9]
MATKPKLLIVLGPTASGKTGLAIKLCQKYSGEIISADSRQIYQEMDIGTAKPNKEELAAAKHHLVDFIKPNYNFTLAEFIKLANNNIEKLHKEDKLPIMAGGTGLYISAIADNYDLPKGKIDLGLRKRLENKSNTELFEMLAELDPQSATTIDPNNARRLIRALEYVIINQKSFIASQSVKQSPYDILQLGIKIDKDILLKRINKRVDLMIEQGLVAVVKDLIAKYDKNLPSLRTVGYQEIIDHLEGKTTLEEAIELIKIHTRQYAKRQMTWFKRDKNIKWIKSYTEANKLVKKWLK